MEHGNEGITNKGFSPEITLVGKENVERSLVVSSKSNADDVIETPPNKSKKNGDFELTSFVDIKNPNKKKRKLKEFKVKETKPFKISYEYLTWLIFVILTILCLVDRFVWSGDKVLGRAGKRVSRLWGTNVGETITNIVWGMTARLIITSQNLMFYTTLWCLPNIISELSPNFLRIEGIRDIHIRMHRLAGIFLIGIPSLAHVLVIFLPPLVDKTHLTYSPPSNFNYSQQFMNLNWTKIWDPAAVENWTFNDSTGVHLTSDEIYRLILMIALFCLFFPLSRSRFLNDRSYSLAIGIHAIAGIWYAIDNIRKITHGLAHVFNLPLLLFWCLDRLLSITSYRKSTANVVSTKILGDNEYIEVRLKLDKTFDRGVGDVYYLLQNNRNRSLLKSLSPERAHSFTSFSNHNNKDSSWDIGFIITVMEDTSQWFPAWTRSLRQIEGLDTTLRSWGPYRSSVWQILKEIQNCERESFVLFASGSGFGYLHDVINILSMYKKHYHYRPQFEIHYTVRTIEVYKHFITEIEDNIKTIKANGTADVSFHFYVTDSTLDKNTTHQQHETSNITLSIGTRINFDKVVQQSPNNVGIYFTGRPSLADRLDDICSKYGRDLVRDSINTQRGTSDKSLMLTYLKITALTIIAIVIFSMFLAIYLR